MRSLLVAACLQTSFAVCAQGWHDTAVAAAAPTPETEEVSLVALPLDKMTKSMTLKEQKAMRLNKIIDENFDANGRWIGECFLKKIDDEALSLYIRPHTYIDFLLYKPMWNDQLHFDISENLLSVFSVYSYRVSWKGSDAAPPISLIIYTDSHGHVFEVELIGDGGIVFKEPWWFPCSQISTFIKTS